MLIKIVIAVQKGSCVRQGDLYERWMAFHGGLYGAL